MLKTKLLSRAFQTLLIPALVLLTSPAVANGVDQAIDIKIDNATLPVFSKLVLKEILKKNYFIDNSLINLQKTFDVNMQAVNDKHVLAIYKNALQQNNLQIQNIDGTYFIKPYQQKVESYDSANKQASSQEIQSSDDEIIHHDQDNKSDNDATADTEISGSGARDDSEYITKIYATKYRSASYIRQIIQFSGGIVNAVDGDTGNILYKIKDEEKNEKLLDLLTKLDVSKEAVTIKAAVLEYTQSNDDTRSLGAIIKMIGSKLNITYAAGQTLANSITFKNKTLDFALSALSTDNNFNYLAEPTLKVINNQEANIIVGTDVPVRGQTTISDSGVQTTSIEYKAAGVIFRVRPVINGNNVELFVNQEISNFANTTSSNIDSPTIIKRAFTTTLPIEKGDLVLLGGLDEEKHSKSINGISFLPKFLHSKNDSSSKSHIILLLQVMPS